MINYADGSGVVWGVAVVEESRLFGFGETSFDLNSFRLPTTNNRLIDGLIRGTLMLIN